MSAAKRADGTGQRERVFAEAMRSIAEVGPERTTMRVLSARLGMSPGHILYYFGSKDRLLLETLQWSEDDLMRRELAKVATGAVEHRQDPQDRRGVHAAVEP